MKATKLSRRSFLRGAGKVALALPLLDAMAPTEALAQSSLPKRLLVFFTPNGLVMDNWRPSGSETNFSLSPILQPLETHKNDLLIMDGIDMESSYHGPGAAHPAGAAHLLTGVEAQEGTLFDAGANTGTMGWGGGISVDQAIADELAGTTPFRSLEFGVRRTNAQIRTRISYRGPAQPVPAESDPYAMYERLFGLSGTNPDQLDAIRLKRQSVIDFVLGDYNDLNDKLGAADRAKLEAHLDAIREVELTLVPPTGDMPDNPACLGPDLGTPLSIQAEQNIPLMGGLQMDLLAQAFACDLTRVALLQWVAPVFTTTYTWLGHDEDHHSLSHKPLNDMTAQGKLTDIGRWYAEQLSSLIDRLKAIPEGDGTVFDNTVIFWCTEIGHGNVHDRRDMPFVLAGNCGGFFDTGRYLNLEGRYHNDLLVTLMNAMGIETTTFGNPDYCQGPLSLS